MWHLVTNSRETRTFLVDDLQAARSVCKTAMPAKGWRPVEVTAANIAKLTEGSRALWDKLPRAYYIKTGCLISYKVPDGNTGRIKGINIPAGTVMQLLFRDRKRGIDTALFGDKIVVHVGRNSDHEYSEVVQLGEKDTGPDNHTADAGSVHAAIPGKHAPA